MKITITIEDEAINYLAKAETGSFETAIQHLASLEKNYARRVDIEKVEEIDF